MTAFHAPTLRVILERETRAEIEPDRCFEMLSALLEGGHSVSCPSDEGAVAPADAANLLVLRTNGVDESHESESAGAEVKVHYKNVDGLSREELLAAVEGVRSETDAYLPGEWKPWFPVIDYDRCTNCMQCLSFCLFDVYGVDDEQNIEVRNNEKCKTNCPACSRVCPDVAILFPKYKTGPINGAEVNVEDLDREKMKTDISALLGGDIYSMLRDRHERAQSRFSKERDETRALKERLKCLKKTGEAFEIPEEILNALPSLDIIREKAAEAFERLKLEGE